MTKRFILTEQFIALQGVTFVKDDNADVDTYYTVDGAVDLLNELNDENEKLKEELKELKIDNKAKDDAIDGLQSMMAHYNLEDLE